MDHQSRLSNDLRAEAEARVAAKQRQQQQKQLPIKRTTGQGTASTEVSSLVDASSVGNATPNVARLAELDYRLNGGRARSNTGDFVAPRWVLDEEVACCLSCNSEFDWFNRRHHCRHCGKIFCDACSSERSLLPIAFGLRDPQRVCNPCHKTLAPMQQSLTNVIANHQRVNCIDLSDRLLLSQRYLNLPYSNTLGSEIRKASYSINNLVSVQYMKDKAIPLQLLSTARGLAFMTVAKGGCTIGAHIGTGLVIAKLPDGTWSAPSAIGMLGCSWGALIGADVTDYVFILTTKEAVDLFTGIGGITVGVGAELAVGPVGRVGTAIVGISDMALSYSPSFSYSHSRGFYAGLSLDCSCVFARSDVNHNFYGRPVSPHSILSGAIPPPRAAQPLYDQLFNAQTTPISSTAIYRPQYPPSDVFTFGVGERPTQALSPIAPRYDISYDDLVSRPPAVAIGTGGMLD